VAIARAREIAQNPCALRSLLTLLSLVLGLLAFGGLAHSASQTLDVAQVRPGMKGYGLTVFRGTQPERFDVEVIDVLHNFRPDQDLILIRTEHPILEKALTVGGMSGSPVYLEGKLVGAYAYGWLFGKEPIAGVTPIANMLAEMRRPIDPELWRALGTQPRALAGLGPRQHPKSTQRARARRPSSRRVAGLDDDLGLERRGALQPLRSYARARAPRALGDAAGARLFEASTPLMLGGFDDRTTELLAQELSPFGLLPLQAGGGARKPAQGKGKARQAPRFVDGGAIGVSLLRGDINATAIGTVTHVAGQRLVAFGHPMMNAGQPALPTSTARVLHVLASERRSFKIAEPDEPLGTLIHDRQPAIVVDTSFEADTLPLTLRIHGVPGAPRTRWDVRVASQRMLTPMLTFSALVNALSVTAAERNDVVFEAHSKVELEGHGSIEVDDVGYSQGGVANPMALSQLRLFDVMGAAYGNPFEDVRVLGVEIDLTVRFGREVVTLVDAMVASKEVDPGSDVNVYLTLRRYGEPERMRIVRVPIPESAAGEKIELVFQPGPAVKLELPTPDDFVQVLDNVRTGYDARTLVVSTKLPSRGLRLRGHVVRDLPGSALDTLQLANESSPPAPFVTHTRRAIAMDEVLVGSARVKLEVRQEPLR